MVSDRKKNAAGSKPELKKKNSFKNKKYLYLAGILALTIIVFFRITLNDFTNWDDDGYIFKNNLIFINKFKE